MALVVEAAELAEIFQWMTPEQSQAARGDLVLQEQVADEVADVLLYLVQIGQRSNCIELLNPACDCENANTMQHLILRPGPQLVMRAVRPEPDDTGSRLKEVDVTGRAHEHRRRRKPSQRLRQLRPARGHR